MKRSFLLLSVLLCTTTMFGQLKVYTNGSVTIDRDTLMADTRFTVGEIPSQVSNTLVGSTNNISSLFYTTPVADKYNYGVMGGSVSATALSTGRSYGT